MLPKINVALFNETIPSTEQSVQIRQMTVKEEKILLVAKESESYVDKLLAIKQVVNNCLITPYDVDNLTIFDMEYLFLKIRSSSISNIVKLSFQDKEDNEIREFDVDLNQIKVKFPETNYNHISVTDKIIFDMKYPSVTLYKNKELWNNVKKSAFMETVVASCINKIYDGDNTIDPSAMKANEITEWIDQCPVATMEQIKLFFDNLPSLYYEINYTNNNSKERKIVLSSLEDFFTFR